MSTSASSTQHKIIIKSKMLSLVISWKFCDSLITKISCFFPLLVSYSQHCAHHTIVTIAKIQRRIWKPPKPSLPWGGGEQVRSGTQASVQTSKPFLTQSCFQKGDGSAPNRKTKFQIQVPLSNDISVVFIFEIQELSILYILTIEKEKKALSLIVGKKSLQCLFAFHSFPQFLNTIVVWWG